MRQNNNVPRAARSPNACVDQKNDTAVCTIENKIRISIATLSKSTLFRGVSYHTHGSERLFVKNTDKSKTRLDSPCVGDEQICTLEITVYDVFIVHVRDLVCHGVYVM